MPVKQIRISVGLNVSTSFSVFLCVAGIGALAACGGSSSGSTTTSPTPPPTVTTPPTPPTPPAPVATQLTERCPTSTEVGEIDRDLLLTFEGDPTAGTIVCSAAESSRDLTLLQTQTYRALLMAKALTFNAPLPWTPNTLYGWLASSIRGLRFRSDISISSCCSPARTPNIQSSNLGAIAFPTDPRWVASLLLLFVHEARHSDGLPHTCGDSGERDNTVAELGAWGVQYHLNVFLADRSVPEFWAPRTRELLRTDARSLCTRFCREACTDGAFPP
jgi:hypothetical protein